MRYNELIENTEPSDQELFGDKKDINFVDFKTIELDGIDRRDFPDFSDAFVSHAEWKNGEWLTDEELEWLTSELSDSGELNSMAHDSLYEEVNLDDEDDMFSDKELFGGRSTFRTVQKLLRDPANLIEMRFMKGQYAINKCIGAQDVDGQPYLFGRSLKDPRSKFRLSWPWSENMDLSTRVVHLGPNHFAIVLKSTTLRRNNKYQGMPFVAEDEPADDDLFGETSSVRANKIAAWFKQQAELAWEEHVDRTEDWGDDELEPEGWESLWSDRSGDYEHLAGEFAKGLENGLRQFAEFGLENSDEIVEEIHDELGIDIAQLLSIYGLVLHENTESDDELFGSRPTGHYWNNRPADYQSFWDELVPASGHASTVQGELLRAANKIYYDYYNNGFGNNWSGALKFIHQTIGQVPGMVTLAPYSAGKMPRTPAEEQKIEVALDQMMDNVMRTLRAAGNERHPNTTDMYSLNDKTEWNDDEDEYDEYEDEEDNEDDVYENEEASDDELFGVRKMWYVNLMGNYNTGRYSDYGARRYIVPGATAEDAIKWLKRNEDWVYMYMDTQKFHNGKRVVRRPARSNIFIDNSSVFGEAPEGTNSAIENFIRKHRAV